MAKNRIPQINLAVVGAQGVGKTTFVKSALDLKHPPISRSSIKKISLDGTIYQVRLLEIAIDKVAFDKHGCIVWPTFLGEQVLPPIDGVLALFDMNDLTSVARFPRMFDALPKSSNIPCVVVACKGKAQSDAEQHDPENLQEAGRVLERTEVLQTSADDPETHKKCVSTILKAVITKTSDVARQQQLPPSPSHNRPPIASNNPSRRLPHASSQHTRTLSEQPSSTLGDSTTGPERADGVSADSTKNANLALNAQSSRYVRSNSQPVLPKTPPGSRLDRGPLPTAETVPEDSSPPAKARHRRLRTSWRHSAGSDAFSSFLDMEDESEDSVRDSSSQATHNPERDGGDDPGVTFDELVDRLLSVPLSKQDGKFVAIFLCLYRKFTTPARLLDAIIARFEQTESSGIPLLLRHADQLRLLNVMGHWASEYPGDFAASKTRERLLRFVASLEKNPIFAFAAKEINSCLETFVEDEDMVWAFSDDKDNSDGVETFLDTSAPSSPATFIAQHSEEAARSNISALDLSEEGADLSSQYSNLSATSSIERSGSISGQSFKTLLSLESAQQEANRLEVIPRNILTKSQWRLFTEIPDEEFAREVTRIDWIMYSSFRPRELIRHVTTNAGDKEKPASRLENVNRMIKQFNHLAYFAASMVLLRDKPKHRAQALEKLTGIAGKLRQLYNYNSLGAIIAGINGTPVYRLTQTRDMLSTEMQKQFMSLVILMGTQKSHFAYRLAWDNSFKERIPFLPLHLRDLVSAEEGNKTFIGENNDRINWRKFEIMGDVVLGVQQSQKTPFPSFHRNDLVQRLLLESKFTGDEEELYNRSLQVEPSVGAEPPRKRFAWRRN